MGVTVSQEWAGRLRRVVPWGSSTCSKSPRLMPQEPGVIVRGEGCRVWSGLDDLFKRYGVPGRMKGLWPCMAITFEHDAPDGLEARFYRAAYSQGVSLYHIPYVTYSHQDSDVDETLERMEKAVKEL